MDIARYIHFSSDTWAVVLPLVLIGIDVLTGLIYAWANRCFSSSKMRTGLSKKLGEIVIIVLGELFSYAVGLPKYIMNGILFYIAFMELMSIIENLDKLGVPLPQSIKKRINNVDIEETTETIIKEGSEDGLSDNKE